MLRSIEDDIRSAAFLAQWHLTSHPSEGLGSREAVSFLEAGNLCLLISRNNDDFVHSFVDAGFEQQRNIVHHDGTWVSFGCLLGASYLLAGDPGVNDLFQLSKFPLIVKHHLAERLPIDGSIRVQYGSSESANDLFPGWLSGLDDVMGELIGINHCGAACRKHLRDRTFPSRQPACEPNKDHRGRAYHASGETGTLD